MNRYRYALLIAVGAVLIPAAQAQFGGVVYDPTQAANAARQLQQGVQMYNTAVQSQQQLIAQYNQMKQMASSPSSYYTQYSNSGNQQWTPVSASANTYGNTTQWMNALRTGSGAASANQAASVQGINGRVPLTGLSQQGQQAAAATGATIDLGDSANATTLQTVGTIRANSAARETDIQKLETASHSVNPADQTQQAVLQRLNQAALIQLRTQQETNEMLQAQAMQQLVQQKSNQDAMKQAMQGAQAYQQTYQQSVYTGPLKTTGYTSH